MSESTEILGVVLFAGFLQVENGRFQLEQGEEWLWNHWDPRAGVPRVSGNTRSQQWGGKNNLEPCVGSRQSQLCGDFRATQCDGGEKSVK